MNSILSNLLREADITKERIQKVLSSGANVILLSGGVDDLCMKYFVEAGAMAVRRVKKADLKRIARATGGKMKFFVSELKGIFKHNRSLFFNQVL